jgi:hypothetical protein
MATKSDFVFRYRVRNWAEYNRALVRRGSLTFWIDEQAVGGWRDSGATGPRGGRPRVYADTAIECTLVVKAVFHLSLRATQGFLESVVQLMGVELPVPNYTTVCKRQQSLAVRIRSGPGEGPRHVVIDSTGLKVYGAGEWNIRKHGMRRGRRRTWRKLHLGVDEETKEIVAVELTTSGVHDGPRLPAVLDQVEGDVGQVSGDEAYDSGRCYEAILARGAVPTIPPWRNARPSTAKDPPP